MYIIYIMFNVLNASNEFYLHQMYVQLMDHIYVLFNVPYTTTATYFVVKLVPPNGISLYLQNDYFSRDHQNGFLKKKSLTLHCRLAQAIFNTFRLVKNLKK